MVTTNEENGLLGTTNEDTEQNQDKNVNKSDGTEPYVVTGDDDETNYVVTGNDNETRNLSKGGEESVPSSEENKPIWRGI